MATRIISAVNFTDYIELTLTNGTIISIEKSSIRFEWDEETKRVFIVDSNDRVYFNEADQFLSPTGTAKQIYDVLNTFRSLGGSPSGDVGIQGVESTLNSSDTPLIADDIFPGGAEDVINYSKITVTVSSDVSSAENGWLFQISDDGVTNWQIANAFTTPFEPINAVFGAVHQVAVVKRFFRVVYINGSTAQTDFSIKTLYHTASSLRLVGTFNRFVDGSEDINYVVARGIGADPYGNFKTIGTDVNGDMHVNIQEPSSSYGDINTAENTPIIQAGFPYNVNDSLFNKEVTGSGTITSSNSQAVISTGAAATSSAKIKTVNTIKLRDGQGGDVVVSGRFATGVADSMQLLGVGTDENGFFIGYNGADFGVFRITDSVINFTPQTSFNIDVLDGSRDGNKPNDPNPSGILLQPTKGNEYKISIHQGFGTVTFSLLSDPITGTSLPFEKIIFSNTEDNPLLYNNTFPLIAEVENTTNTTDIVMNVQSLSAFINGKDIITGALRSQENNVIALTAATEQSIFILRGRSTFNGVMNCVKSYLRYISLGYPQNRYGTLRILRNPTFTTAPTYTNLDTNNSTIEYDLAVRDVLTQGEVLAVRQAPRQAAGYDVPFENLNRAPFLQPNDILAITFEINISDNIDAAYGMIEDL